ncbi:sigma-70 family RNA polymerase sigma factor [Streptomyces roseirectus]|uniref:Sigma-70 family RNA polymerase sigma factor n=2 Tax=Streptomyces roseirectus TaxID=2768066 RepID=A0A7H0ITH2_9ACTN|nr:sigma-70 family RNA polymerase sigma factor [Streptomyces roseirectus]
MTEALAARFEEHRPHLRAVAYRMLGSLTEAEDAVQETWLRLARQDPAGIREIRSLAAWLTTVTSRICLDLLNARTARGEQPIDETFVPDPVITPLTSTDPEAEAVRTDSVGLALLIVLETLDPAERVAFVLHDLFAVPFDDIAEIVERTPATTRQLASRARRKVQDATPAPPDPARQRRAVEAFLTAARAGDFDALLTVLDPDVVLRADAGALAHGPAASKLVRGAARVAGQALLFREFAPLGRLALIGGEVGVVHVADGRVRSVMGVSVVDDRIVALHILADPGRLAALRLPEEVVR